MMGFAIALPIHALFCIERIMQCAYFLLGNKKGLRFAPKALIFLELAMGIEPATG